LYFVFCGVIRNVFDNSISDTFLNVFCILYLKYFLKVFCATLRISNRNGANLLVIHII